LKDRAAKYAYVWFDKWFAMKTIALVIGWVWLYQCGQVLNTIEPMKTFIPHDLLGVDAKAEIKDVKRAYRKLSREKHPDKNPDNPNAVQEFIQITKAYTVSNFILNF
jgi:preprotein translocase subunit Sec63